MYFLLLETLFCPFVRSKQTLPPVHTGVAHSLGAFLCRPQPPQPYSSQPIINFNYLTDHWMRTVAHCSARRLLLGLFKSFVARNTCTGAGFFALLFCLTTTTNSNLRLFSASIGLHPPPPPTETINERSFFINHAYGLIHKQVKSARQAKCHRDGSFYTSPRRSLAQHRSQGHV